MLAKIERKYLIIAGFTIAGLVGGYLYWHFIGCTSGSCGITSKWHMSMLFGGLMGYLIGDSINDLKNKAEKKRLSSSAEAMEEKEK